MLGRNALAIAICGLALVFMAFLVKEEALGKRDSQPLVGIWKLIDEQTILSDGTVLSNRGSSAPTGILVYDASGHVASQLFRPNTIKKTTSSRDTPREYEGYLGTYAVDRTTENHTIAHAGARWDAGHACSNVDSTELNLTETYARAHSFLCDLGTSYAPSRSERIMPISSIQMRWLRAAGSSTNKLGIGLKRKIEKISAAATVPSIPARRPKREATNTMTRRNRNGTILLAGESLKTGVAIEALIAQALAPSQHAVCRVTPSSYLDSRAHSNRFE